MSIQDPLFKEVDAEFAKRKALLEEVTEALNRDDDFEEADPSEEHMRDFLLTLGMDMSDPNLLETPKRVAKMYRHELLSGYSMPAPNLTSFEIDDQGSDQVTVTGIPVHSLCAHHLMPIAGFAAVSAFFMPDEANRTHLLGLSKFARVVEMYSRRLQTQEVIGRQVANYILENTTAVWVGVHIKADHFCMSHRGVRIHGSKTITTKFRRKELTFEDHVRSEPRFADYTEELMLQAKLDYELTHPEKKFHIEESRSEELKRSFLDEVHSA